MTSLRLKLVVSLCTAVLFVGVAGAALSYLIVAGHTKRLLDDQLRTMASAVAARTSQDPNEDDSISVSVWNLDGSLRYSSNPALRIPHTQRVGFSEVSLNGEPYRFFTTQFSDCRVTVAQAVDARDDQAEVAAVAALAPALVMLPVLALVIATLVTMLLRPIRDSAREVAEREPMASNSIDESKLPREIAPLVSEINRLLRRQQEAVRREQAFLTDAAHALRTPLTALQLQVDILDGSSEPAERQLRVDALRAGIHRAARLSDQLLAMAERGSERSEALQRVEFDGVLTEVCTLYRSIAQDVQVLLQVQTNTRVTLLCDRRDLVLIFANLLDNAIRHAPTGSTVEVCSTSDGLNVSAEICDRGPGLGPAPEGENAGGGSEPSRLGGFGLRAVDAAVERLGGKFTLSNRHGGESGLVARVSLPINKPVGAAEA